MFCCLTCQQSQGYLKKSDKTQDAAGFLLARYLLEVLNVCFVVFYSLRFVSRPDLKGEKLPEFLDWCLKVLATTDGMISIVYVTMTTFFCSSLIGGKYICDRSTISIIIFV